MTDVFVSWSGGKDCSLACYRAIKKGYQVRYLANTVTADGQRSCSHGMSASVIRLQAEAMGIPIVQRPTTQPTYEGEFTGMLRQFKQEGIRDGIFGDIDFNAHYEWIHRVCASAGVTPHLPLWLENQSRLMREFIDSGFEAVVVATKADLLGEEWVGRKVDTQFVRDMAEVGKPITPCGEAGEYHTLVVNGPIFKKRLEISRAEKVRRGDHWFLEISDITIAEN